MELLYANSDSAVDAPATDFSGPLLAETPDGSGDVDSSSVRDFAAAALSPGFSSKAGSM